MHVKAHEITYLLKNHILDIRSYQHVFPYELYGGRLVSQINQSLINDWFCGCK